MKLKVNPNRMELLRLKKRKGIAERGYNLLQDKLEKLLGIAHKLIPQIEETLENYIRELDCFLKDFIMFRASVDKDLYLKLIKDIPPLEIEISSRRVFNLDLLDLRSSQRGIDYKIENSSGGWDSLILERERLKEALLKIVELFRKLELVSEETFKTRRRVNALEYILLPSISESIKYIDTKLEDLEREFLIGLLRIKDIIRK